MGLELCWNCNCKHLCNEVSEFYTEIRMGTRCMCWGEPGWARLLLVSFRDMFGNQWDPILSLLMLVQELGLSLRHLSVIWSGTGSLMLKTTAASFREDWRILWIRATGRGWIIEAWSAKPWAHKMQGPCIRDCGEDRGNVNQQLKICEPLVWYCWDSVSRDCEERCSLRWSFSNPTLLNFCDTSI